MGNWLLVLASWLAALACASELVDRNESRLVSGAIGLLIAILPLWVLVSALLRFEQCSLRSLIGEEASGKLILGTVAFAVVLHFVSLIGVWEGRLIATTFAATNLFAIAGFLMLVAIPMTCLPVP